MAISVDYGFVRQINMKTCIRCNIKPAQSNLKICRSCRHIKDYEKDPVLVVYQKLRSNAKRRGKVFTLTLDYFRQFCADTDYIRLKGISGDSLTIDRIDPWRGYEDGNIQVLTNTENIKKRYTERYEIPPDPEVEKFWEKPITNTNEECPF